MFGKSFNIVALTAALASPPAIVAAQSATAGGTLTVQRDQAAPQILIVNRSIAAVNYRPRQGDTEIGFVGTALLPGAKGSATVSGEKGYMRIEARFDKLQPPARFGPEYLTYVLWAVTRKDARKILAKCNTTMPTPSSKSRRTCRRLA